MRSALCALGLGLAITAGSAAAAQPENEKPKYGGILTYMIAADAPPSFDGHREGTFAMLHATAPFYSVLVRFDPADPADTTRLACDLCTELPAVTDGGTTYTFKIRTGVKFHDGSPLTAQDVAASWHEIIFPRPGVLSVRQNLFALVDSVEAPDDATVVFKLKYASSTFMESLADPYAFIYPKRILDKDPHWFEQNVLGSGPFRFVSHEIGQSIKGERNKDYYHTGLPYLDGFVGIFAPKQATRVEAIRSGRAAIDFRGLPPSAVDQLKRELGDKVQVQGTDWNCGNVITPNSARKPFDDARVRKALALAIDQWHGAPALSKIAIVRTVGGIVFPGAPMAATKAELEQLAGYWPDIDKARAEARRLLKEAGQENLHFELMNRNIDQPYKYVGTWVVDEWRKIGVTAVQKMVPTGPWLAAMRSGNFEVLMDTNCPSIVSPVLNTQKYLPHRVFAGNYGGYDDQALVDLYDRMLHETDTARQRALMREYEKLIIDTKAYEIPMVYWYREVPYRSYVHGWKIAPTHYINQDLSGVWLDKVSAE